MSFSIPSILREITPLHPAKEPIRCLIVDDDPVILELWRTVLLATKIEIAVASTARAARQKIDTKAYDILILDWCLDRENGSSVLDEWMCISKGPACVVSGKLHNGDEEDIYLRGACHVLNKPIPNIVLRHIIGFYQDYIVARRCADRVVHLEWVVYTLILFVAVMEGPRAITLLEGWLL